MINPQEIEQFLQGSDDEKYIISVEFDYVTNSIFKIIEDPKKGKIIKKDQFIAFAWVGDLKDFNFYSSSKSLQKQAMSKHGITIEKLQTMDNERLENGLKYMVKSIKGYRSLVQFFRDGGIDPWADRYRSEILILPAVEQYLISKEKRLFKGFDEYSEITRLVFDLETTSLNPKNGRIIMIGIKTNKGFKKVIECADETAEIKGIVEFFEILDNIKPSIIGSYNGMNFDWQWLIERSKSLGLNVKDVCKSLNPAKSLEVKESMLKLANEVERYDQVSIWGYNNIDILHSVRRAQAINSDIKEAGLKYITKYIEASAPDRVYIDHTEIASMYANKEEYWFDTKNGKYKKISEGNLDESESIVRTTGDDLVERYLDDDLEETLLVDEEFNQASFLLASMIPTTYERISTMGTATLWEMLMRAWSYKNNLAIPYKEGKRDFVGGLSRLIKIGYSRNILKLDFSSLYPSIQLVHDVFPSCDVMGAMKGMLKYFRDTRIKYKELAEKFEKTDSKKSLSYSRKQLPIKIFINSMFGALSAPQVFHWGSMEKGEQITCTGRQYLRMMIKFFTEKGYVPTTLDTDGVNYQKPDNVETRTYMGKGLNWKVIKNKEYSGATADVAEFNDTYMRGEMALDMDGEWTSCMNLSRKNYATLKPNGKIKLTGNTIKSKKLPKYIESFLDGAFKLLLEGKGQEFVEYYYEYLQKIFDQKMELSKVANRAKVKISLEDYVERLNRKNKSGGSLARMAHMELAIRDNIPVSLGDVIYYVNSGTRLSHGDVAKKGDGVVLNCYRLENEAIEKNPEMTGVYNIPRSISTFNKRIEPLLVVFKEEVRNTLLVSDPEKRGLYTKEQCELINGVPFEPGDQDSLEEILTLSKEEDFFWESSGIDPNYIYSTEDINYSLNHQKIEYTNDQQ